MKIQFVRSILALSLLGAPILAVFAAPASAEESVLVDSGRRSFQRHCSACHGMDAQGGGILKPVLRVAPPDLTRIAARRGGEFPADEIARFIDGRAMVTAHGLREMPVWGRVFGEPVAEGTTGEEVVRGQLWVLVSYLESIQVPAHEAPPAAP